MYNSKYYTCEEIDQRLLEGYYDDAVAAGYTGSKAQYLAGLLKAINYSANPTLTADKVVYNPAISGLTHKNVQGAIDELANNKADKAYTDVELNKKFDKESILQESGYAEDKVMSQKAVSAKLSDLGYNDGVVLFKGILDNIVEQHLYPNDKGYWESVNKGIFVKITKGDVIRFKNKGSLYAFLTTESLPTENEGVSYVKGCTRTAVSTDQVVTLTAPSGANCLYMATEIGGTIRKPTYFTLNNIDLLDSIISNVNKNNERGRTLCTTFNQNNTTLIKAIGRDLTEYQYEEVTGELYMNSSGGIVKGQAGQHIRYIPVKYGDCIVISSKDQPFDDMEFASAAFFTQVPKLYSFAKEIISRGGNFTIEYTCLEDGYIAVWQKSNEKAKLYTENVGAYQLVQAKEDGVLTGYYIDTNGKITSLNGNGNSFKVHYFHIKKDDSVYITDKGHLIAEDYNFTKAIFTTIEPSINVTGTIIIGRSHKNQVVYTANQDGYISIQERNPSQLLNLYNRTKQTILEHISTESADVYDVNEHTNSTHLYGLTATKQRAFVQFNSADENTDTTIELTCGENRYTATISKSSSVSILAEEFINAFSLQVKDYNMVWAGGSTVTFSAKEEGNKGKFSAEIISSSSTKISFSVNYGVDSALELVPYNQYKLGRIIRFFTNPALSSGKLKDAYENWIYVGNTPDDFHDPTKWELLGNKYSYEGKLLTSIGDSTSAMGRWQPFVCRELCCTYTASAISGGTLSAIYKSTIEAVSPDSDFVTIQYGTNDWANESLKLGNVTDMADGSNPTTFCGALNYVCKWLSENVISKNPYCRILMWTPLQRNDGISKRLGFLYGYEETTKEAKNKEGKTLADYADAIIKIAGIWGFSVLDTHRKSGINRITIGTWNKNYIASNHSKHEDYYQINSIDGQRNFIGGLLFDGLHPNYEPGGRILGHMISEALKRI